MAVTAGLQAAGLQVGCLSCWALAALMRCGQFTMQVQHGRHVAGLSKECSLATDRLVSMPDQLGSLSSLPVTSTAARLTCRASPTWTCS